MALVEPLLGHLLSKHVGTIKEGLEKISSSSSDGSFAVAFLMHPQAFAALQEVMYREEMCPAALQTLTHLVEACDNVGVRSSVLRDACRGNLFRLLRTALTSLSDITLPTTLAALQFLAVVANYIPKLILSRFGNTVPLHLASFRLQLPYSHRRVRIARTQFLINLVASPHATAVETVLCTHGYLTHVLEDAAELLQEGTEAGVKVARAALQVFGERFIEGRISAPQKRSVLLGQKHIIRLLVKALDHTLVSDCAANILHRMVVELVESPADYQVQRMDTEDRGMPNYLIFFILRQLHPKTSQASARLVIFILHQAPDLIRPYFTRVSGHLSDDGNSSRISASTAGVATLNIMTRAMLAPIPYHLAAGKAKLQTVDANATTFFTMSSENVAEEVCPVWVAEHVHRLIIGSSDLLMLSFAIQLTYAILTRAKAIQRLIFKLQDTQSEDGVMCEADRPDWETYNAKVQAALLKALPRREEFWHRMTQQLHPLMLPALQLDGGVKQQPSEKVIFLTQRMMLLMQLYGEVFHLRISWLSAVPSFLPVLRACINPIQDALCRGEGVVVAWPPPSISALCSLLVSSIVQGVSMTKLHHITMSTPKGGILEWPLLLCVMLWAVKHRNRSDEDTQLALAWVARLVQWTVHSVTVRFLCELEEAFLWIEALDESALPCFIHLLNYLLQRSLSKSADRIAQELMQGDTGVIVSAARSFVAKGVGKTPRDEDDVAPMKNKQVKPQKEQKMAKMDLRGGNGGFAAPVKEIWTNDLQDNLSRLDVAAERVTREWPNRVSNMRNKLQTVFSPEGGRCGKRRIAVTVLQAEKEHRALRPPHDQVLEFCRTLRSPTPSAVAEEELQLLSMISSGALDELMRSLRKTYRASVWCTYPTVAWELAGLLLRRLSDLDKNLSPSAAQMDQDLGDLISQSKLLLKCISDDASALTQVLLEHTRAEGKVLGFLLLFLAAVRVLLREGIQHSSSKRCTQANLDEGTLRTLSGLILRTYTGSVSTTDRIRYSILLVMSYLQQQQQQGSHNATVAPTSMDDDDVGAGCEDNDDEDTNDDCATDVSETSAEVRECRKHDAVKVFSGVLVPHSIMEHRFLIMNHQSAPHLTPEVDMLSLLVDTWTDEEVLAAALQCPARMHNTILVDSKGDAGWDLLRGLFPEFSTSHDMAVASFDTCTASNITDPRYLLPLLHAVLAMPPEQLPRKNIGTKCIPFLLRSLSFTDEQLRCMGAASLPAVWTPSGPTRIVVGFARLKMTQLAAKRGNRGRQEVQQGGNQEGRSSVCGCPRLPAPISAFLVMALRPLGLIDYPLHNDIMRFLLEAQEALSTPVPLHRFLMAFPLACVTTPLMIKRQELMQCKMQRNSIAASSSEELLRKLRSEEPIHLDFIIRLIRYGCHTNGDMMALICSESLQAMMMIISMVSSSADIRLRLLSCLHAVCTTSASVATQAIVDGHVLLWLLGFVDQLTVEYGKNVYLYGEPLFMEAILLLQKLCRLVRTPHLHAHQVQQQIVRIRDSLALKHVTTKGVLDVVDDILREMHSDEMNQTIMPPSRFSSVRKRLLPSSYSRQHVKSRRKT